VGSPSERFRHRSPSAEKDPAAVYALALVPGPRDLIQPAVRVRARVTATIYPGSRHGAARVQDRRAGARSKETER